MLESHAVETEKVLNIIYQQPQAIFKICAVIGCNSSLEGYGEAVISVTFIPRTLAGSNKWVRGLSREPLRTYIVAHYVASSSKDVSVCIWDTTSGCYEHIFMGHTHSVTCL